MRIGTSVERGSSSWTRQQGGEEKRAPPRTRKEDFSGLQIAYRTNEMCTPRFLCVDAQFKQIKTP